MLGVGVDVGDGVFVAVLAAVADTGGLATVCVADGSDDNVPGMEQARMVRIMNTTAAYLLKNFLITTSA